MVRSTVSDADVLAQIPAARRRARASRALAIHAWYQSVSRQLHVILANGVEIVVPVDLIASLRRVSDVDLAGVRIGPAGVGLRWERLDQDLSVAGLAQIAVGRQTLLSASGAAGGAARTAAKARASRINGQKGGRPRKGRRVRGDR